MLSRLVLLLLLCCLPAFADEMPNNIPQMTSSIPNARYELVISSWMRKETFRLDRYSGRIWQLTLIGEGDGQIHIWEEMKIEHLPSLLPKSRPHFQIFLSGVWVADTYLIDTDSGRIWRLTISPKIKDEDPESFIWELMLAENSPTSSPKP
jgi:hypothetical protein